MKASVLQENLKAAVALAGKAASTGSTLPVLGNVLIEAKDGLVQVACTNLNVSVRVQIAAKVDDEGATTVPSRLFKALVDGLPPERVDFRHLAASESLEVKCGNTQSTIKGISAKDFPLIASTFGDEAIEGSSIEVMPAELRRIVSEVAFAAAKDEERPRFASVEVSFADGRLKMAATDGYRVSVVRGVAEGNDLSAPVLVPAKTLSLVVGMLADADEDRPVRIVLPQENRAAILFVIWGAESGKRARFRSVEVVGQLTNGTYPDYRQIIPKATTTKTVISVGPLMRALKTSQIFAKWNANIVNFTLSPGEPGTVRIEARGGEDFGSVINEVEALIEGEPLEISFNVAYLTEFLAQCDKPDVIVRTTRPTRPAQITPCGVDAEDDMYVVMPMHPPKR